MADYSDYKECTDCVHYELCLHQEKFLIEHNRKDLIRRYGFGLSEPEICCNFRDRSRFVELPCKIGDTVYSIYKGDIEAHIVNRLEFCTVGNNSECQDYFGTAEGIDNCDENFSFINFTKATFGKTVFLTREEAEQALRSVIQND